MAKSSFATVTIWTSADQTVGAGALVFVTALGSAAASTITILDGTDIKSVIPVAVTAGVHNPYEPTAFSNMVIDLTGTAAYSIGYIPTA